MKTTFETASIRDRTVVTVLLNVREVKGALVLARP